MDCYNDNTLKTVVLCFATQVGKTEMLNNTMGYIVHQEPAPVLVMYPTEVLAKSISVNRLQPMLKASPVLAERWFEHRSLDLELQFQGMYIALTGSNAPASVSSRPIKFVLIDEADKAAGATNVEADSISLARERTKTFWNGKVYIVSTPTTELGAVYREFMAADVRKHFHVPCPHCGELQQLVLAQVKWPEDSTPQQAENLAYYECLFCHQRIDDRHKQRMLLGGEWRADGSSPDRVRSVGYQLNSIYSPWLTFGQVARQFMVTKDDPNALRNFVNSWLAEPWRDRTTTTNVDDIMAMRAKHRLGTVPEGAVFLTMGVDVQLDHMWYEVRAWGERITSWQVDCGRAETWVELEDVLVRDYRGAQGEQFVIYFALIDSGYRTDEVYQFCTIHANTCSPSKGASGRLAAPYSVTTLDKGYSAGVKLYNVDTHYFKSFIMGRLKKALGEPGAWMLADDTPLQYAQHLVAEQLVTERNKQGLYVEVWKAMSSHAQNHFLDCSVYAAAAAEKVGVRYVRPPEPEQKQEPESARPTAAQSWLSPNNSW